MGVKYTLSSIGVTSSLDEAIKKVDLDEKQMASLRAIGVSGVQMMNVKGTRLNNTKQQKSVKTYDADKRLELQIISKLPFLDVRFIYFTKILKLFAELQIFILNFLTL